MSNTELIDALIAAYNTRDPARFVASSDPSCKWHPFLSARVEGKAGYRGHDGIRAWLHDLDTMFSEIHAEASEVRDLGDRLVAFGTIKVRGRESGAEISSRAGWLFEMHDGRMRRGWSYPSREEALAAARLSD
jgi:ketosteroid isomerase-like protein